MDVHGPDDRHQERQELGVRVRIRAGIEEVLTLVGAHRPVVVLARPVDAGKRLLVAQEREAVLRRDPAHQRHDEHVVVGADRRRLEHRRHLELGRGDLVVAGLGRDAEPPQLTVEIHHEGEDPLPDRAEVLVLELLALRRRRTEQRPPGQQQVGPLLREPPVHEEVLLLGTDRGEHPRGRRLAEPAQDAQGLLAERLLGSQEGDLVVERLAGERHVRGRDRQGDAVRLDLQEDRRGDVPGGVPARLEGCADPAGRERARVRFALDQVAARELRDRAALAGRRQERVVLLGGRARHRHEPVRVVGGPVRQRPLLHRVRDRVGDGRVERLVPVDGSAQLLVGRLGEVLALGDVVEDVLAVDVGAGAFQVVLRLRGAMRGDPGDRGLARGHARPRSRGVMRCDTSMALVSAPARQGAHSLSATVPVGMVAVQYRTALLLECTPGDRSPGRRLFRQAGARAATRSSSSRPNSRSTLT